jgi:hypothetical protein
LEANRRASWRCHVDSRLDAIAMEARRGAERSTGGAERPGEKHRRRLGQRRGARAPGGGAGEADLRRGGGP